MRYVAGGVLATAVVTGALLIQYVWGEPFYDAWGAVSVRGSELNATNREVKTITRAMVEYRGFVFNFAVPLKQVRGAQTVEEYAIQSYRKEERRLIVHFEKEVELHFYVPEEAADELLLRVHDGGGHLRTQGADYLVIAHRCAAHMCAVGDDIVRISERDENAYLYLPPESEFTRRYIRMSMGSPIQTLRFSAFDIAELLEEVYGSALQLLEEAPISSAELQERFVTNAYQNWQGRSFVIDAGQWRDRAGEVHFRERIMLANLAEGIVRGEYTRTFNAMRRAYQQNRDAASIHALPYIGDSVFRVPAFVAREEERAGRLEEVVNSDAIFDDVQLLHYLYFRASREVKQQVDEYIANSDHFDLSIHQLLNLLHYLFFELERNRERVEHIMMNRIVPHMLVSRNGIFVKDSKERIDFMNNIRVAALLKQFSEAFAHVEFGVLGDALRYSTISLADSDSYIPLYALLENEYIINVRGYIDPADVYGYFSNAHVGDGHYVFDHDKADWLLSAAEVGSIEYTQNSVILQVNSAAVHNFYLLVGESDRPQYVQIGDAQYYDLDSEFETRLQGWYWFSDYRMLIINMHQSSSSERIVIQY